MAFKLQLPRAPLQWSQDWQTRYTLQLSQADVTYLKNGVDIDVTATRLTTPAATTGTQTPTFAASNKPGTTGSAGPAAWIPVTIGGAQYWIPAWAN